MAVVAGILLQELDDVPSRRAPISEADVIEGHPGDQDVCCLTLGKPSRAASSRWYRGDDVRPSVTPPSSPAQVPQVFGKVVQVALRSALESRWIPLCDNRPTGGCVRSQLRRASFEGRTKIITEDGRD